MQVFRGEVINNSERQSLLGGNHRYNEIDDDDDENNENRIDMKSFLTACAANLYEYYDFALLGFFATEISASLFPSDEPGATGIVQLYVLYAVGFVARPFGGLVFGYLGDKFGR